MVLYDLLPEMCVLQSVVLRVKLICLPISFKILKYEMHNARESQIIETFIFSWRSVKIHLSV